VNKKKIDRRVKKIEDIIILSRKNGLISEFPEIIGIIKLLNN